MKEFSTNFCSSCRLCPVLGEPTTLNEIRKFFQRDLPLHTGPVQHWRLKAKLAVRGKAENPLVGLFRENSHEIVDISECPAHHPSIRTAIAQLKRAMIDLQIAPYNEFSNPPSGIIRYVQLFVCRRTGKVQLVIVSREKEAARKLAQHIWNDSWHSIWINTHPAHNNRILGDEWELCFGERYLFQGSIAFHPGAFAQANLSLFDQLLDQTTEWIPHGSRLLEIYAGVGMISLRAQEKDIRQAVLVENNPFAYESFLNSHPPAQYQYVLNEAKGAIPYLREADCVIVDPPRKGLDRDLLNALQNESSQTLIYISCSFDSFQRDATALRQAGWSIEDAGLYWLFPGTEHVEIAAKWKKTSQRIPR